jgi:hypothetical protein
MAEVFFLSLLGLAYSFCIGRGAAKSPYGVFHPAVILTGLAALDTFIPGVLWPVFGMPDLPWWETPIAPRYLTIGLIYYLLFYLLMLAPVLGIPRRELSVDVRRIDSSRLAWLLVITLACAVLALLAQVAAYGGWVEWFWQRTKIRWVPAPAQAHGVMTALLVKIPWRTIFNSMVLCAFHFRYDLKKPYLYGVVFPLCAVALAITTFFRGSVLLLLLGLAFVEFLRLRKANSRAAGATDFARRLNRRTTIKIVLSVGVASSAFVGYGIARAHFEKITWGVSESPSSRVSHVFLQGSGLDGIGHIVQDYGSEIPYFMGRTYFDMLLLPLPRAVYPAKREWYGITDISNAMGWPESTQSAVTIPGEAFANFGWLGLLIAPLFGRFLAELFKFCVRMPESPLVFLYPGVLMYILFIANWMSFTGVMNLFISFILVHLGLNLLVRRSRVALVTA